MQKTADVHGAISKCILISVGKKTNKLEKCCFWFVFGFISQWFSGAVKSHTPTGVQMDARSKTSWVLAVKTTALVGK